LTGNFTFKPAQRENVGLWVNMIGGTGSGKTMSAFRMASGISGDKPFAVIDAENRRALHYADRFKFDHAELRAPFRPDSYAEAVLAADAAGYPVIVVDSGSHVWAGDGGMLDWQEEELDAMVERAKKNPKENRSEWQVREASKMSAWIKPKMAHKHFVSKLLQIRAHLILCLRAEQKIEMVKDKDGKTRIQAKASLTGLDGWIPICDKNLPFEATCSFLLTADKPGIPKPIKLQEQHRAIFPLDAPIDEDAGKRLAEWAAGGTVKPATAPKPDKKPATKPTGPHKRHCAETVAKLASELGDFMPEEEAIGVARAAWRDSLADFGLTSKQDPDELDSEAFKKICDDWVLRAAAAFKAIEEQVEA